MNDSTDSVTNWLSILEAAEALGIPKGKVNRLLEEYSLVAVKKDGQLMIPAELIVDGEPLPPQDERGKRMDVLTQQYLDGMKQ